MGLSIGSSSIKIAEIKRSGKFWKLSHFGVLQIPEALIVNREIVNLVALTDAIKNLCNQIKLKNKSVCIGISGSSIMLKKLLVEVPNKKDLKDQVYWEAEQYVPFDISEVLMDYYQISRNAQGSTEVLLVAAKRQFVETYVNAVLEAGLKVQIVDLDILALNHVLESSKTLDPTQAVALIDIGASSTKIAVVVNKVPVFTKDVPLGGYSLTAEIQRNLNLSFLDAEALKLSAATSKSTPQEVFDLINTISDNFVTEIKRALDFYNASSPGASVSIILLSGGSSQLPHLTKVIEETLKVPTQMLNPFSVIRYDSRVFNEDFIESIATICSIPIGLAMRAGAF